MKKIVVLLISLLLAVAGILFVSQPSSAMPCDGPGCTGESNTGYPGGRPPAEACSSFIDYKTTPDGAQITKSLECDVVTYQCDVQYPTKTVTRYTDSREPEVLEISFLTAEEVLVHCNPPRGDLPVESEEPPPAVAVPNNPTPDSSGPINAPLKEGTGPVANTVPNQVTSQVAHPAELAYTGFDWVAAFIGTALLFGGVMLLRWKRKFA